MQHVGVSENGAFPINISVSKSGYNPVMKGINPRNRELMFTRLTKNY